MKKLAFFLLAVALLSALIYSQRGALSERLFARGALAALQGDALEDLPDGLHAVLCGAGGPLPSANRSGPCVLVIAGEEVFAVDAGTNGLRNINRMRYPVGAIKAVLLTHYHSDHIDGLGEMATLRWVAGNHDKPLPVFGPEGLQRVVAGFNAAYSLDSVYRNEHHGDAVAPPSGFGMRAWEFQSPAPGKLYKLWSKDDLQISAFTVEHEPASPAVGYLFQYKDRSLLISGDTKKSANLQLFAKNVDLLIHEALAPHLVTVLGNAARDAGATAMAKITGDILDYHATPVEAAETARDAQVGHLLYYHIVPPLLVPGMEAAWARGVDEVFEHYTVGKDGTGFTLPAGSKAIVPFSKRL